MKKLLLIVLLGISFEIFSQSLIRQDMYFNNMNYINAAAGVSDTAFNNDLQLYMIHKFVPNKSWTKAPNVFLNYISKIDKIKGSINIGYVYDNYSFFDRHLLQFGYATHLRKGNHHFDVGLRAVMNVDHLKDRSVYEGNAVTDIKGAYILPDIDFGFQYRIKGFTLGLSAKNLLRNNIVNTYKLFENERIFYSNISYTHSFAKNFQMSVFTLPSYTTSFQIDLGLDALLWKKVDIAYFFRLKELRHVYRASVNITHKIYFGLSFSHSHVNSDYTGNFMFGYRF